MQKLVDEGFFFLRKWGDGGVGGAGAVELCSRGLFCGGPALQLNTKRSSQQMDMEV